MSVSKLKELSDIFKSITSKHVDRVQIEQFFKNISRDQVKFIIEIVVNLLAGTIPISNIHKHSLRQYNKLYRRIASKTLSFNSKRNLIRKNIKPILILIKLTQFRLNQLIP